MATKQKYTNRTKATIWNKNLRMKERALAQMQQCLDKCKERETANAGVQILQ